MSHIIHHNGRTYDLTALETPFGLLPEPVQVALRRWPHGWEYWSAATGWCGKTCIANYSLVSRAKPAPAETRVGCMRATRHGKVILEIGTCIKRDGEILWDTWEPEA